MASYRSSTSVICVTASRSELRAMILIPESGVVSGVSMLEEDKCPAPVASGARLASVRSV
ncbi:hypothetical protein DSLASN_18220 [Desulfoluna limicola]|uniref:Uncharacterized protein n=1 Tax=Desulfoluna limicola TaxID=2810562 RepID=A0ABM7PFU3_9BACT|nr:hypothetical protein DSLASN_18220 [Desulfoluna limicola]